jgi:hypothetical protein
MSKKAVLTRGLSFLSLAAVLAAAPAWAIDEQPPAGEPGRPERHDWRQLDERVGILERVKITGLLEVEAFHRNGYLDTAAREKENDILLATAALDFHAQLTAWASAHVLLLWEEGATEPVEVEEAVISLGNPERFPLFLNVGKMYVPFGAYGSYMIQDPLTLELGETNSTAVQVGFQQAGFYGSAYAFKGEVKKADREDTINNFGVSTGYAVENEEWGFDVGLGYLRNLAAAGGILASRPEEDNLEIEDYIGGFNAYLHLNFGPVTFYSEYITALDDFAAGELGPDRPAARPRAWHAELGYTMDILEKATTFAVGYQGTSRADGLALPEHRYLAAVNVALADNLSWTVEYLHDRDYKLDEGGTGGKAGMFTTQLAFAF